MFSTDLRPTPISLRFTGAPRRTRGRDMTRSLHFPALLAAAALLAGCATVTPYQPQVSRGSVTGGYTDTQVEPDRLRVSFAGNTLTSRETVEVGLLYRAAELTLARGYDWFELADRATDRKAYVSAVGAYGGVSAFGGWGHGFGHGVGHGGGRHGFGHLGHGFGPGGGLYPGWGGGLDVRTTERFTATAEILLRRGAKPADDPRAFDARAVQQNLEPLIRRPAAASS
ncbi:MAG: hypothetical protein EPN98_05220 [Phenylobacterium sp.]|nr:MAG: hypothetical protein EPN98_05220 [Phenylobacterium sp.]